MDASTLRFIMELADLLGKAPCIPVVYWGVLPREAFSIPTPPRYILCVALHRVLPEGGPEDYHAGGAATGGGPAGGGVPGQRWKKQLTRWTPSVLIFFTGLLIFGF